MQPNWQSAARHGQASVDCSSHGHRENAPRRHVERLTRAGALGRLLQFGGMFHHGLHGRGSFESRYRCYSVACVDKVRVRRQLPPPERLLLRDLDVDSGGRAWAGCACGCHSRT